MPRAVVGSVFVRCVLRSPPVLTWAPCRGLAFAMHGVPCTRVGRSTALYCGVAIVVTGMVLYSELDPLAPLSTAFRLYGMQWAEVIVAIGALLVRRAPAAPHALVAPVEHVACACGRFSAAVHHDEHPCQRARHAARLLGDGARWLAVQRVQERSPALWHAAGGHLRHRRRWYGGGTCPIRLARADPLAPAKAPRLPSARRHRTAALLSLTLGIEVLADMVSIGTLFAFMYAAAPQVTLAPGQRLINDAGGRHEFG